MIEKTQRRQRFQLPFRKSFPWTAQVTVDLPEKLGSERRIFHAKGEKTFEFLPIKDPHRAALKLIDLRIILPETDLVIRPGQEYLTRPVRIPELTIGPEAIDFESSSGFVELSTGRFALQFTIRLTPQLIPLLGQYQIEELPISVHEGGRLNLGDGAGYDSVFRFNVTGGYEAKLPLSCCGIKTDCRTWTRVGVALSEPDDSVYRSAGGGTVYVCPGDRVYLWWNNSEDVKNAKITPEIGEVERKGYKVVYPKSTTVYKIYARGECERDSSVKVHVVEEGDYIDIYAWPRSLKYGDLWQYVMSVNEYSKNIAVTSITVTCCIHCFSEPIPNVLQLDCNGNPCWPWWSCLKINPDDTTKSLSLAPIIIDLPKIPLAGIWQFSPQGLRDYTMHGLACFRLWITCNR